MRDTEEFEKLRRVFPKYSSAMIEAHLDYYRTCDPMYFLRVAAQFELPAYETTEHEEGRDLLPDNKEKYASTRASFLRYLRYLASEKLMLLLVSGYPFGPAPKTFVEIGQNKMKALAEAIAERRIPDGYGIRVEGKALGFQDWLKSLLFQGGSSDAEFVGDFANFIARECGFLCRRDVINAFKHGRTQAPISGQAFQIHTSDDSGDRASVLQEMTGAVHWLGWETKQSNQMIEHAVIYGFEETDADQDYDTIKSISALEKLIVDIRRGLFARASETHVFLPDLASALNRRPPQRMRLKASTSWKPESGRTK